MKTCPETDSAHPRESYKHWIGVSAEDIPQGWMDDMVKRLFEILNRDMIRLEGAQIAESDTKEPGGTVSHSALEQVAKKERLLAQMQRSLERLTEMELKRVRTRKPKKARSDDEARRELKRRIDQIVAADAAQQNPPKSE